MALSKIDAANFLNGTIPSGNIATSSLAAAATGKVLQVVQGTATTTMLTTSTAYADTNLTANITPSSTSSKIYVTVNQNVTLDDATDDRVGGGLRLLRVLSGVETVIYGGDQAYEMFFENNTGNATQNFITVNRNYLDSPSSTSQLTYKTQGRVYQSGDQLQFNGGNIEATITLMEIAG